MNDNMYSSLGNLSALRTLSGLITNVNPGPVGPPGPDGEGLQVTLSIDDEPRQLTLPPDAGRFDRWAVTNALKTRRPVYATVDNGQIVAVRRPVVGRVSSFEVHADGPIHFTVDSSPRRFVLPAEHDARLATILERSSNSGGIVMVDIDLSGAVLHVDPAPWEAWDLAPMRLIVGAQKLSAIKLGRVKVSDVPGLFQFLAKEACPIGAPTTACIPFNFPDTGCNARAHKMCTILAKQSVASAKAWLFDPHMVIATRNAQGRCEIGWSYHVVPYVRVHGTGPASVRVLEPALFPGPVTLHAFVTGLHSSSRHIKYSRQEVYEMSEDGSASLERTGQCDDDLDEYREEAAERNPQPPYC